VIDFEALVLEASKDLLVSLSISPWASVQCVEDLTNILRPLHDDVLPLSKQVVAWMGEKMAALLAQLVNDPDAPLRLLRAIDCRAELTCDFSVAVEVTFLDLLTKQLPAHLSYTSAVPFCARLMFLRMFTHNFSLGGTCAVDMRCKINLDKLV
jgi:hypothetical protein